MPTLQPWLKLTNKATCESYEIISNCQTLAYITAGLASARWEVAADCDECCPECQAQPSYLDPAEDCSTWWADSTNPAAAEFLGIIADSITLEPALSSRRRGDTTMTTPEFTPRRLEISGRIVAAGERGTAYAWERLTALLGETSCSDGPGWEAEVRLFCPGPGEVPAALDPWTPQAPPTLINDGACAQAADIRVEARQTPGTALSVNVAALSTPCVPCACDPCDRRDPGYVPERLGPAPMPADTIYDSGRRTIMDVRLVSIDEVADSEIPACDGAELLMVFEVFSQDLYGEDFDGVCEIGGFVDDEEHCRPYDWTWACRTIPPDTGDGCGIDPLEAAAQVAEVPTISTTSSGARSYCFPLWRSVRSCLVPLIPTRGDIGMNFEISAGFETGDVRNLSIEIWAAHEGQPDPASCEGEQYYRAIQPDAALHLPWLPRGGVLQVDSGARRILRSCAGRPYEEAASSLADAWDFPGFDPECRYWVVVTADCLNVNADTTVAMSFTPRYKS